MGKKYIIELPENTHWIQWLMEGTEDHHPYMDFKSVEGLTPYTEPDLEQVRKEAYEKGYKKCMSENDFDSPCISCDKYEQGLNDAWEAARKIVLDTIPPDALIKLFGNDPYSLIGKIFEVYSASEVIARIKAWEKEQKEQKEIKVGDEVEWTGDRYVVTYIDVDETYVDVIDCSCGSVCDRLAIKCITKTGRHFPEIASVLQKMRGEEE